jgi:hypothetical protein
MENEPLSDIPADGWQTFLSSVHTVLSPPCMCHCRNVVCLLEPNSLCCVSIFLEQFHGSFLFLVTTSIGHDIRHGDCAQSQLARHHEA